MLFLFSSLLGEIISAVAGVDEVAVLFDSVAVPWFWEPFESETKSSKY